MLSEITAIAIDLEADKGTQLVGASLPTTDIYVEELQINPTGSFIRRNGSGIFLGNTEPGVIGGRMGKCTFTSELRGTGSGGLEPGLAILLQACGFLQTAQVYNTHSLFTAQKTITIDVFEDGMKKVLYGAAGTFTIEGEEGQRVLFRFDFDGLYADDIDVGIPAYSPSTAAPIMFGGGSFAYDGESQLISKFSLDAGMVVSPKQDIAGPGGVTYSFQSTYDPVISWDPESDLVANDNVHGDWVAGNEGVMQLVMADASDTFTLAMILVQYKEIPEGIRNNLRIYDATGQCRNSSGNDSIILTVTATV